MVSRACRQQRWSVCGDDPRVYRSGGTGFLVFGIPNLEMWNVKALQSLPDVFTAGGKFNECMINMTL